MLAVCTIHCMQDHIFLDKYANNISRKIINIIHIYLTDIAV